MTETERDSGAVMPMPRILYGTAWKGTQTAELVCTALVQGFRGVDTAAQRKHYREDLVGAGLSKARRQLGLRRGDVWVQTKFTPLPGQDTQGPLPYDAAAPIADQVCASFQASLRNLHPDEDGVPDVAEVLTAFAAEQSGKGKRAPASLQRVYIDSYLLHSPLTTLQGTVTAWRVMEALVDAGLVRQIGISNVYDPEIFQALFKLAKIKPGILQNRWHGSTGHDVSLLALLSPALSPNLFPAPPEPFEEDTRGIVYQPFWILTGNARLLQSHAVAQISAARKLTPEQVVYAFISQGLGIRGLPTCVLSGTTDERHMREAVEAVRSPPWSDEEIATVRREVYGE
ncbi:hypothetical protein MSPP1_003471 [Malassezia sp. CBS 17886]|nr:hypothetical protein MSPP1_003471 [Malassezia sp. CBS 17886]